MYPTAKCRLRLLKLERIKDFLLLEKEYIRNQEVFKVRGRAIGERGGGGVLGYDLPSSFNR